MIWPLVHLVVSYSEKPKTVTFDESNTKNPRPVVSRDRITIGSLNADLRLVLGERQTGLKYLYSARHHFPAPDLAGNKQKHINSNYIFSSQIVVTKTL